MVSWLLIVYLKNMAIKKYDGDIKHDVWINQLKYEQIQMGTQNLWQGYLNQTWEIFKKASIENNSNQNTEQEAHEHKCSLQKFINMCM